MASEVVFPLTAAFTADGTAKLRQVQQEVVAVQAADYNLFISDASANDIFKAFRIREGVANDSADIVVDVIDQAATTAAISHALKNALGGESATFVNDAVPNGEQIKLLLESYMSTEVGKDLSSNGIFDIMEAEALFAVDISEGLIAHEGSTKMWNVLNGAPQAIKNVIATQLPYSKYSTIDVSGNLDEAFAVGDTFVLRFQVSSKLAISPELEDVTDDITAAAPYPVDSTGVPDADATPAPGAVPQYPTGSSAPSFDSLTKVRTFNIYFKKAA